MPLLDLGTRAEPRLVREIRFERSAPLTLVAPHLPAETRVEIRTDPAGWLLFRGSPGRSYEGRLAPGHYLAIARDADGVELLRRTFTLEARGLELTL